MDICSELYEGKHIKKGSKVEGAKLELEKRYEDMQEKHPEYFNVCDYTEKTYETNSIILLSNSTGIYPKEPKVFFSMIELMKNAKERVDIHTPYIICNEMMYESLSDVGSMDIDVRLMTNSVANNGNPFGAGDYRKNKNKILETGISIYEYEGGVSYHGKSIAIDNDISIIGSFNMDMRSAYLNTELMLVINSEDLNTQLRRHLEVYELDSRLAIDDDNYITPAGLNVQKLSLKKMMQINIIQFFGSWARFLM